MSQLLASHQGSSLRHLIHAFARTSAASLWGAVAREWRYRCDLRSLQELDARGLHDLGITTGGLEHLVRHGRPPRSQPTARRGAGRGDRNDVTDVMPSSWTEWR